MQPRRTLKLIAVTLTSTFLMAAISQPASAQLRREGYGPKSRPGAYVTAESRWGNGRISGLVRQGRFGLEVRLPGGSWIECVRSCSETLRKETVDFWQSHGNQAPDTGPGYFRWVW
jgi:catechol 2,3-dioxygenase-like lactoylglutathione lyase family enzyme